MEECWYNQCTVPVKHLDTFSEHPNFWLVLYAQTKICNLCVSQVLKIESSPEGHSRKEAKRCYIWAKATLVRHSVWWSYHSCHWCTNWFIVQRHISPNDSVPNGCVIHYQAVFLPSYTPESLIALLEPNGCWMLFFKYHWDPVIVTRDCSQRFNVEVHFSANLEDGVCLIPYCMLIGLTM